MPPIVAGDFSAPVGIAVSVSVFASVAPLIISEVSELFKSTVGTTLKNEL